MKTRKIKYLMALAALMFIFGPAKSQEVLFSSEDAHIYQLDSPKKGKRIIIIDTEEADADTIEFDIPGKAERQRKKKDKKTLDYFFVDIGVNGYTYGDKINITDPQIAFLELDYGKSIGIGFDKMYSTKVIGNWFRFMYGFGIDVKNYRFKGDMTMVNNNDTIMSIPFHLDGAELNKNKFVTSDFHIPLMLHFMLGDPAKKPFHLAVGGEAALVYGSKIKQKYELNGDKGKDLYKGDFNVNPFQYRALARVGFENLSIFGQYSFASLFQDDFNPELNTFSIGISFGGFDD